MNAELRDAPTPSFAASFEPAAPGPDELALTERAAERVKAFLAERGKGIGLRVAVRSSGCSGMAYKLEYADAVEPGDSVFDSHGAVLVVDDKSLPWIGGTLIDHVKEGLGEGFKFLNPRETSQCGCGKSFSV